MDNNYSARYGSFLQKKILELEAELAKAQVNRVCRWNRSNGRSKTACGKVLEWVPDEGVTYCFNYGGKVEVVDE